MEHCEICGNAGANPIRVIADDTAHDFDCFECAIHAIAPRCDNCGCRIIGHGVSTVDSTYCCDHCRRVASDDGPAPLRDEDDLESSQGRTDAGTHRAPTRSQGAPRGG